MEIWQIALIHQYPADKTLIRLVVAVWQIGLVQLHDTNKISMSIKLHITVHWVM